MGNITVNELISSALQKYCDANDRHDPCLLVNKNSIEMSHSDIEGSTTIGFTNAANDVFEIVCSNNGGKFPCRESFKMGTISGGGDGVLLGCVNGSTRATASGEKASDAVSCPPDTVIGQKDAPVDAPVDVGADILPPLDTVWPETEEETAGVDDAPVMPDTTQDIIADSDSLTVRLPKDTVDSETAIVVPQEDAGVEAGVLGEVTGADVADAEAGSLVDVTGADSAVAEAGVDTPVSGVDTPLSGVDTSEPQDYVSYDAPSMDLQGIIFAIDPNQDQCYVTDFANTAACVTLVHQDDEFNAAHLFNSANSPLKVKIQKSGNAKEPADFDVIEDTPSFKQYTQLESLDITDSIAIWSIVKYTDIVGFMTTSEIVGKVQASIDYFLNPEIEEYYEGYNLYIYGKANFGGILYDCVWKNPPEENTPTPPTCGKEPL